MHACVCVCACMYCMAFLRSRGNAVVSDRLGNFADASDHTGMIDTRMEGVCYRAVATPRVTHRNPHELCWKPVERQMASYAVLLAITFIPRNAYVTHTHGEVYTMAWRRRN